MFLLVLYTHMTFVFSLFRVEVVEEEVGSLKVEVDGVNPLVGLIMMKGSLITQQPKRTRSGIDPSVDITAFS